MGITMSDCDHKLARQYARRVFSNGSVHFCVQCTKCLDLVKLPEHSYRPFIRPDEIPIGRTIHEWISREGAL